MNSMTKRQDFSSHRRWVIKIGSALLTNDGTALNTDGIARWAEQVVALRQQGLEIVLVSSGAVAEGMTRLGWKKRPSAIHELQAAAAVGQMGLIQTYESCFKKYQLHTAQILLTHDDLSSRQRYLNARSTLRTLLDMGVIPVVNENDTVATDEIRFGDNDTLAALVANLVEADGLVILTDQDGLFDKDPRQHADANIIHEADVSDLSLDAMAKGGPGTLGRGGMTTKLRAARTAARSGASTLIASGRADNILVRLYQGELLGTLFAAEQLPLTARKQWLAGHLQTRGKLVLDAGAVRVIKEQGKSLLAVGVKAVEGQFKRGEVVLCLDERGNEIARGLVNYHVDEVKRIKGKGSDQIEAILGYEDEAELIHRDNLVLV